MTTRQDLTTPARPIHANDFRAPNNDNLLGAMGRYQRIHALSVEDMDYDTYQKEFEWAVNDYNRMDSKSTIEGPQKELLFVRGLPKSKPWRAWLDQIGYLYHIAGTGRGKPLAYDDLCLMARAYYYNVYEARGEQLCESSPEALEYWKMTAILAGEYGREIKFDELERRARDYFENVINGKEREPDKQLLSEMESSLHERRSALLGNPHVSCSVTGHHPNHSNKLCPTQYFWWKIGYPGSYVPPR